jgi:hypothetical protein
MTVGDFTNPSAALARCTERLVCRASPPSKECNGCTTGPAEASRDAARGRKVGSRACSAPKQSRPCGRLGAARQVSLALLNLVINLLDTVRLFFARRRRAGMESADRAFRGRAAEGIVRPSALAVLRLMTSLNVVGCWKSGSQWTRCWRGDGFELSVPGDGQCRWRPFCAPRLLRMDRRTGAGVPRFSSFVVRGKPSTTPPHTGGVGCMYTPRQITEYK